MRTMRFLDCHSYVLKEVDAQYKRDAEVVAKYLEGIITLRDAITELQPRLSWHLLLEAK